MRYRQQRFGTLECHVVDGFTHEHPPELGAVFCHGFGAPGSDLAPLAQAILQAQPELTERVQFLFPEAPLNLADLGMPGGRAWWPLSLQKVHAQLSAGRIHEVCETIPEGIDEARNALRDAIDAWRKAAGLDLERVVLGGFSQGAMITLELTAALDTLPAGLIVLSGTLIRETAWKQGFARKHGLPVLQTHGHYDMVLPYLGGTWLKDVLEEAAVELRFVDFAGGHEIPWEVLEEVGRFLQQQLKSGS